MDLNAIMSNIYGEGSSQNFNSLGFSGGNIQRHQANVKYLDETSEPNKHPVDEYEQSYRASKIFNSFHDITLSGGASDSNHVYPSAEYINNEDLQTFIREFYLHYLVIKANKNMLLVVPSSATLKKLVADFKALLKKEGIQEMSPDASRFAAKSDLPFKQYIFDVYGRSSPNNDGFLYQVPDTFPDKGSSEVYRRTNRASKQYFFRFNSASKIEVANNEKLSGASTLKFLGKCDRSVLVLQGDIPPAAESKGKVVSASLQGGSKSNPLRHQFMKCVKNANSIDDGAYEFIARVSHATGASKVAKYYSGDFTHSAFSIIAANELNEDNFSFDTSAKLDLENEHAQLVDNYHPVKNIVKMDKVAAVLPKILNDATTHAKSGPEANTLFIANLRKMYGAIKAPKHMLYADIAASLTKSNDSPDSVRNALSIISAVEDAENNTSMAGGSIYSTGVKSDSKVSTSLIRSVYSAISASPFIGSIAKEFTPLLIQPSFKHSAFEDNNMELLNEDNEQEKNESKCPCEGKNGCDCDKPKDAIPESDFDIKAFW